MVNGYARPEAPPPQPSPDDAIVFADVRCSLCGASRLMHKGKPGVCTFVECKDPFYDLKRETPVALSGETPPVCFVCAAPATKRFCEAHQNRGTGSPFAPLETPAPAPARPEAGARPNGLQWRKDNGIEMRGTEFAQLWTEHGGLKRWMTLDDILNEFAEAYAQQQLAPLRQLVCDDPEVHTDFLPVFKEMVERGKHAKELAEQLARREQELTRLEASRQRLQADRETQYDRAERAEAAGDRAREALRDLLRIGQYPPLCLVQYEPGHVRSGCMYCIGENAHKVLAALATPATADVGCICQGNWRTIVKESEGQIGQEFIDESGDKFRLFGIVHGDDDYYYGMKGPTGLRLLSCVGNLETHGFTPATPQEDKPE